MNIFLSRLSAAVNEILAKDKNVFIKSIVVPSKIGDIIKTDMSVFESFEPSTDAGRLKSGVMLVIDSMLPEDRVTIRKSDNSFNHIKVEYEADDIKNIGEYIPDELPSGTYKTVLKFDVHEKKY